MRVSYIFVVKIKTDEKNTLAKKEEAGRKHTAEKRRIRQVVLQEKPAPVITRNNSPY